MSTMMQYIMRSNAMALIPYFNDAGEVETIVLEQEQYVYVKQKPYSLIESNLRYYGSSMRGAKDGVTALLGKTNMAPIPIQT
ncbi:MAG: competence protein ComK, partial [Lysinibacillus sp.]